jgi:methylated-DNA-[protein]-cysteine S-methyltransferase
MKGMTNMSEFTLIDTPVGCFAALERNGALAYFGRPEEMPAGGEEAETPLLLKLREQLGEYFDGKRKTFDIPLCYDGTPWHRKCWEGLLSIPCGETRSYGWLASYAGNPKAARAAGGACHANPIIILIPCHRIVGANGSLTGFGAGMDAKAFLLALERNG